MIRTTHGYYMPPPYRGYLQPAPTHRNWRRRLVMVALIIVSAAVVVVR